MGELIELDKLDTLWALPESRNPLPKNENCTAAHVNLLPSDVNHPCFGINFVVNENPN